MWRNFEVMGGLSHESGGFWVSVESGADGDEIWWKNEFSGEFLSSEALFAPDGLRLRFWPFSLGEEAAKSWRETAQKSARAARFGEAILEKLAPDAMRDGAANLGDSAWRALRNLVPETARDDQSGTNFSPRLATEYAIYEATRARKWLDFLELAAKNPDAREPFLRGAGELMIQSHFSLDHRRQLRDARCDALVEWARKIGVTGGVYGAKIGVNVRGECETVGVWVLGEARGEWETEIEKVAQQLAETA